MRRLIVLGLFATAELGGQTVRGTVSAPSMPGGVSGAVIQLVDSLDRTASRVLADAHGNFIVRAPSKGTYSIHARRIGLRPLDIGPLLITFDTTLALTMQELVVGLPAVTSSETSRCQLHPDSRLALALLWEDAKTALLASAITREQTDYRFDVVAHARAFDASERLVGIALRDGWIANTRSWVSHPPQELRDQGYVITHGDSVEWIAPDIETLLSPYFADTHCFRVASQSTDDTVAVAFEPAEKPHHAEIAGTLRIDRRTRHLVGLNFNYVNAGASRSDDGEPFGGHVEFTPLSTGAWVITDWWLRVPAYHVEVVRRTPTSAASAAPRVSRGVVYRSAFAGSQMLVRTGVDLSGGTVRRVFAGSTEIWARPARTLKVQINGKGAIARLVGSEDRIAIPDSNGVAEFDGLVEGSYLVDVSTPVLDLLGWPRTRVRVDVGGRRAEDVPRVRLDSPLVAARVACAEAAPLLSDSTGVLIGTVARGEQPLGGVTVRVTSVFTGGESLVRRVQSFTPDGRFIVCGVKRDAPIDVRAEGAAPVTAWLSRSDVVGTVLVPVKP